jgi:hypothetical protein
MLFREVILHRVKSGVLCRISVISIFGSFPAPKTTHLCLNVTRILTNLFNFCPYTTEHMSFSLQDGATAHIENSSVHFLRCVFGDNNN